MMIENDDKQSVCQYEATDGLRKVLEQYQYHTAIVAEEGALAEKSSRHPGKVEFRTCTIDEEIDRLMVLKSYSSLFSGMNDVGTNGSRGIDQRELDRLTRMGSRMFQVPICVISLVDLGRVFVASSQGMGGIKEKPRRHSPCAQCIFKNWEKGEEISAASRIYEVRDIAADGNHLLFFPKGGFYAGTPLVTPEGTAIGTYAIVDTKPRPEGLTADQQNSLVDFADMALDIILASRQQEEEFQRARENRCQDTRLAHQIITATHGLQLSLSHLSSQLQLDHDKPEEVNTLRSAVDAGNMLVSLCQDCVHQEEEEKCDRGQETIAENDDGETNRLVDMDHFVQSLRTVLDLIPNSIHYELSLDTTISGRVVSDGLTWLRATVCIFLYAMHRTSSAVRLCIRLIRLDEVEIACEFDSQVDEIDKEMQSDVVNVEVRERLEAVGGSFGVRLMEGKKCASWFAAPLQPKGLLWQ